MGVVPCGMCGIDTEAIIDGKGGEEDGRRLGRRWEEGGKKVEKVDTHNLLIVICYPFWSPTYVQALIQSMLLWEGLLEIERKCVIGTINRPVRKG